MMHASVRRVAVLAVTAITVALSLSWAGSSASAAPPSWGPGPVGAHHSPAPHHSHGHQQLAAATVAVGGNPVAVAVDPATDTAYVGNGNDNTVSVVDTSRCNAHVTTGCSQVPPTVAVGSSPVDAVVDQLTDTVYVVANNTNQVFVIDGATCNAHVQTSCATPPQTITVGEGPDGIAVDQKTNTIYVTNTGINGIFGDTVSVINGATCDSTNTSGCDQVPATVTVGVGPAVPAVDEATDTIYVPNAPPSGPGSVSVINGATCNAQDTSGCGQVPATMSDGPVSVAVAVDPVTNTLYEAAFGPSLGSLLVFNAATCDAQTTTGCGQAPHSVPVGSVPIDVVVNPITDTVFVANEEDSDVTVVDGAICNATHFAGCSQHAPAMASGFNDGYLDVNPVTDTVYVTSQNNNTLTVLNGASCSLTRSSGCIDSPPTTTVGNAPQGIAVDQQTSTVYAANRSDDTLSVINADACNAQNTAGCSRSWHTVAAGPTPQAVAVNEKTDTIYLASSDPDNNGQGTTVAVLNGATCNAHVSSGCGQTPQLVTVGNGPDALAVDPATNTIYVANGIDDTISVIDGRHCDGTNRSGCGHAPAVITLSDSPGGIAVDSGTNTVYVTDGNTGSVSVINGKTCDASVTTGCGQVPATVAVGSFPDGIAVDDATHTAYVENVGDNTVSVIDGRTCNSTVQTGCGQSSPTMAVGGLPFLGVAVDQLTDTVVVGSVLQSADYLLNGATCNSTVTSGCNQVARVIPSGGWPTNEVVDDALGTVYTVDNVDGQVTVFGINRTH
jgi:DNA-binding beta-propeller fold protein YncE